MLILTIDGDSFADWRAIFHAVLCDTAQPLSRTEELSRALVHAGQRRYDVLYLDMPETGAAWTGLSEQFWSDPALQKALDTFRDLGGLVTGTLFIDSWQMQYDDRAPYELASRHGWITLPHGAEVVTATSPVPWDSATTEMVEILLYAADGAELELWVNEVRLWRRGEEPEGARLRLQAFLHPGDNTFTIRAQRRPDRGFGFCLGIRGRLEWKG